jgi:hypothetical protein
MAGKKKTMGKKMGARGGVRRNTKKVAAKPMVRKKTKRR